MSFTLLKIFIDKQSNELAKERLNKCQEIYNSTYVCMMQNSLAELVVIAMVNKGF